MRKHLLLFFIGIVPLVVAAEVKIRASAMYLSVNGSSAFYNARAVLPQYAIGDQSLETGLGIFGRNTGNLKIEGAQINALASTGGAVARIFYIIYKAGERPASPVFGEFILQPSCKCNGGIFGCGGGACENVNDQKFQNVQESIDLTNTETGNYVLEVFFRINAGNEVDTDDNASANYRATFTITAPLAVNITKLYAYPADEDIRIKWSVQNDADVLKYEIQKSANGLNFTGIDSITSFQNPAGTTYYFIDGAPIIGTNYYRIRSYSVNGAVSLSNVFRIYYGKVGNSVLIYPNPVDKMLNMRFAGINRGNYKMSVLGTNGQVILTQQLYHDGTDKTIRVPLPDNIQRGIYRVFLINKQLFYKQAFMVK